MSDTPSVFSLVRPFLPIVGILCGIAVLIDGLVPVLLPSCTTGYSTGGLPILGSCASSFDILLIVAGAAIVAVSASLARSAC